MKVTDEMVQAGLRVVDSTTEPHNPITRMRNVIEAALAAAPQPQSEWVTVPREPTEAMCKAGWTPEDPTPAGIWALMLAAAPPALAAAPLGPVATQHQRLTVELPDGDPRTVHVLFTNRTADEIQACIVVEDTPAAQPSVADLRDAKWLDPECADRGACQSLRFKAAQPSAEPSELAALLAERDHDEQRIADLMADVQRIASERDELVRAGGWIACSDRMPLENTPVLVWDANLGAGCVATVGDYDMRSDGPCWGESLNHEYRLWNVTHWQPLPAAPAMGDAPEAKGGNRG